MPLYVASRHVAVLLRRTVPVSSQAARQSFTVLMASTVVVLKHETSALRQNHNLISIDFTFPKHEFQMPIATTALIFGVVVITSQRGSAGRCEFGPWLSVGKHAILEKAFGSVMMSV